MTNPSYTDEQVLEHAAWQSIPTKAMILSLLAARQRMQAEVGAFRDIPKTIQRYDVDADGGGPYMLHHGDYVLHSDLVDALNTARANPNETKEAKS